MRISLLRLKILLLRVLGAVPLGVWVESNGVRTRGRLPPFTHRSALSHKRTYEIASLSPTRLVKTSRLWLTFTDRLVAFCLSSKL